MKSNSASAGLGLGLSIAAGIVEAHGGRLWLDRERTIGSVFRFTLRRADLGSVCDSSTPSDRLVPRCWWFRVR